MLYKSCKWHQIRFLITVVTNAQAPLSSMFSIRNQIELVVISPDSKLTAFWIGSEK